jgi:hypothetical protein
MQIWGLILSCDSLSVVSHACGILVIFQNKKRMMSRDTGCYIDDILRSLYMLQADWKLTHKVVKLFEKRGLTLNKAI